MEQSQLDRRAYQLAKDYLPSLKIHGVTAELIETYLKPTPANCESITKNELYRRLLESAQNANMKSGVIGKAIGGFNKLSSVLCDFNPGEVLEKYKDWGSVLDQVKEQLKPRGKMRSESQSIWPKYCRTILSAASFVEQFKSADDFLGWVDFFDKDERSRASLPMLIDKEIDGLGFALACDFLKELGYVKFPKPDIHLRDIFTALKLCDSKADNYQLFKAIVRLANNAKVSPYEADKVFWLIGSGNFYNHPNIGKKGKIGSNKKAFIKDAQLKLYNMDTPKKSVKFV